MDKENKYWFSIWSLVATFLITSFSICTFANHLEDAKVAELINNGKDPLTSSCAIRNPSAQSSMYSTCIALPYKNDKAANHS